VTAARWNTNPCHNVGFFDRDKRRPFSELLAAASEYFAAKESNPSEPPYLIRDVRYRIGRDGVPILEVDVLEMPQEDVDTKPAVE
jgi:hypothetical protein